MAKKNVYFEHSLISAISPFNGEKSENISHFLENIHEIADIEQWDEKRKFLILKLNLQGRAKEFLNNDPKAKNSKTFDELQTLLLKKFKHSKSFAEIQHEYSKVSQLPNQTVRDLANKIHTQVHEYMNLDEESNDQLEKFAEKLRLTKFIDALRTDIRVELKKSNPKTFDEAIEIAQNIEQAFSDPSYMAHNIAGSIEKESIIKSNLQTQEAIQELANKIDNITSTQQVNNVISRLDLPSTSTSENHGMQTRPRLFCLVCGKGHLTLDCWHLPKIQNSQNNFNRENRGNYRGSFRGRQNNYRGRQQKKPYKPYQRTNNLN